MSNAEMAKNEKTLPYIVAVDFDGTLVENKFPELGEPYMKVFNKILELQKNGAKIILWTCRSDRHLEEAIDLCDRLGLHFDAVNDNLPETKAAFGGNVRKIFANIYIDDRAVFFDPSVPSDEPFFYPGI